MTTNHKENLDPALIRNGRVDVKIELKSCDKYQIASIYKKIMNVDLSSSVIDKIPEYKHKPIDIISHLMQNYYDSDMTDEERMSEFYEKK